MVDSCDGVINYHVYATIKIPKNHTCYLPRGLMMNVLLPE